MWNVRSSSACRIMRAFSSKYVSVKKKGQEETISAAASSPTTNHCLLTNVSACDVTTQVEIDADKLSLEGEKKTGLVFTQLFLFL